MQLIWNLLGKPLAWMGGRSAEELRDRTPGECDKSIAVGVLCLLSGGIIDVGHWLFWGNFPHTAEVAGCVAAGIATVFMVMYRLALRAMETMAGLAKLLTLLLLGTLMGVNALLAGHELVLLAFKPQVQAQAALGAAQGVTAYATAVENSLGLPQLRSEGGELDKSITAAQAERGRVPDGVQQLQSQARGCDAIATQLQYALPTDPDHPGYERALRKLFEQRGTCRKLNREAAGELARHQSEMDRQLGNLHQQRSNLQQSLSDASNRHRTKLAQNSGSIAEAATTGFARHEALWAAVGAGTVPAWAAYGLMTAVLLIDAFSFVFKLLVRDDVATTERVQQTGSDAVYNGLHAEWVKQQRRATRQVVRGMRREAENDLSTLVRTAVAPSVAQDVEARSFARAAAANQRARQSHGAPVPSMLGRLGAMAAAMRQRFHAGPAGAAP